MNNILQNIADPKDREQSLKDTCHSVVEGEIRKSYSAAELQLFKDQLMTQSIEMNAKIDELKALSAPLKMDIKELKTVIRDICTKLRDKFEETAGIIYQMDDQESGIMYLYDSNG